MKQQRPFPWLHLAVALALGGILIVSLTLAISRKPAAVPMGLHYTEIQTVPEALLVSDIP